MGNTISSAITHQWMASHKRRVKEWLDDATEDTVLDALTTSFIAGDKGYGGLPAARHARSYIEETFGAYGSIDQVDKKRYWLEKDLELFMSNRFPGSELSASIPILWRCFHFHAFFPFPQESQRINYTAFQRAIGFLAAEGNLRLGDNADGITMDADEYPDAGARASKRLWILFRSLSRRSLTSSGPKMVENNVASLSNTEEDLMEVLALLQPDNTCIMPAPIEELRPHARRILDSSTQYTYSSIPRAEFLNLLKLILSVQLDKPEWGDHEPYFYTGRVLTPPDPDIIQGTADAILRKSTPSDKGDVDCKSFQNILNVDLPDFVPQLRLIFTSFLYPFTAPDQLLNKPTPKPFIPVPYAQYLNLFLHPPLAHPKLHVFEEFARQEAHYALQTIQPAYSASPPTLNIADLVTALRPIKTGTLLLITGEAIAPDTQVSTRVAIGACMPTPWDIGRERSFRASPPQKLHRYTPDHVLFQLEPSHRTLRPEPDAWIMDLIHLIDSDPESGTKGELRFGAEGESGLCVDFTSGIATLRNVTARTADNANNNKKNNQETPNEKNPSKATTNSTYHSADSSTANADGTPAANNWCITLRIQKFELYNLGGHATPPFEESLGPEKQPRLRAASPAPYKTQASKKEDGTSAPASVPQIGEEALKKRIQGFGSNG